jgi:hypothetical protein
MKNSKIVSILILFISFCTLLSAQTTVTTTFKTSTASTTFQTSTSTSTSISTRTTSQLKNSTTTLTTTTLTTTNKVTSSQALNSTTSIQTSSQLKTLPNPLAPLTASQNFNLPSSAVVGIVVGCAVFGMIIIFSFVFFVFYFKY